MILAFSLGLMLVAQATPPAADPCPFGDNRCKAELYLERARAAVSPRDRALYLFGAHRLYLRLFDEKGADADLCASRRAYDRGRMVEPQSEDQRAKFAAQLAELRKRERDRGTRCGARRKPKSDPPLMTAESMAKPPSLESTSSVTQAVPVPVITPPAELLEVTRVQRDALQPVVARAPDRTPSSRPLELPRQARQQSTPRGRGLVIAGSATLGVGLALTAIAGYLGGRLHEVRGEARRIDASIDGFATDEQAARSRVLIREYERLGPPTLALALVGGTSVVVGAVLVGVGGRRLARIGSRAALLPLPGGLVFRARF